MSDKRSTQLKVGIFVVIGLLFSMYMIFMVGGEQQLFQRQYSITSKFKDISGLRVGAPIQLAGLKVGFVDRIKFPESLEDKDVELTLHINRKYQDRIRKDSVATINTQGLLGDKFVYISVGSPEQQALVDGDSIESRESVSLYNLAEKGGSIISDISEASKSLRKFFEDMYASKEDVRSTLRSMKNIMQTAEKGEGLLHAMVYDPKGKAVVADIASSMAMLKDIIGRADEADKKSGEVSGVLKNLRTASNDLKEVAAKINRGEGTVGGLINDPSIYNDIRSLFGRANRNKVLKAVIRSTLAENDKNSVTQ